MFSWTVLFAIPVTSSISRTLTLRSSIIRPLTVTEFSSLCEGLGLPLFLWIIIQCHLAIFKFVVPHRHFLSAENVLALTHTNLQWISLWLTPSACKNLTTTRTSFQSH
jgi:hypothetical protein